jgi:hypothetical protein
MTNNPEARTLYYEELGPDGEKLGFRSVIVPDENGEKIEVQALPLDTGTTIYCILRY